MVVTLAGVAAKSGQPTVSEMGNGRPPQRTDWTVDWPVERFLLAIFRAMLLYL